MSDLTGTLAEIGRRFGRLQRVTGGKVITIEGPLLIIRGDDIVYRLTVTDDQDARVNLTGASIDFQIRITPGASGSPPIAKSVGSGITLLDQTSSTTKGQADIAIDSADTLAAGVPAGLYWLDVLVTASGKRHHAIEPQELAIADTVTP